MNPPNGSKKPISDKRVTFMINSLDYFLLYVLIVEEEPKKKNRLIVINGDGLLYKGCYNTIKGAKRAFLRRYNESKRYKSGRNSWSPLYHPDELWLNEMLEVK